MLANKRSFWADLSRKTGTWAGVTALALAVGEQVEEWLDSTAQASVGAHHAWAVLAVAVLRAVIALVQGNTGDGDKASFTKPVTVHQQIEPPLTADDDPAE